MLVTGVSTLLMALSAVCADTSGRTTAPIGFAPPAYAQREPLRKLYDNGKTFPSFLSAADSRRTQWLANYRNGRASDSLVARANAVSGIWRLLVIAEDWCGDSMNTIPYIARLVEAVPRLEMRVVGSKRGRKLMKAHLTPDGRAATPTVILLDERFYEAGCWIERPSELQTWFQANKKALGEKELHDRKYEWYARDKGEHTVREIVEMIELAAAGKPRCAGKS